MSTIKLLLAIVLVFGSCLAIPADADARLGWRLRRARAARGRQPILRGTARVLTAPARWVRSSCPGGVCR